MAIYDYESEFAKAPELEAELVGPYIREMSADLNMAPGEGGGYDDTELRERVGALEAVAENIYTQYAYPEIFGAVGDKKHDDTAAIQAAIDATTTYGNPYYKCVVKFGAKPYKITSPIILSSEVTLEGQNENASNWGHTRLYCEQSDVFGYAAESVSGVSITGISFLGDEALSHNVFSAASGTFSIKSVTIRHCCFQQFNHVLPTTGSFAMTIWNVYDFTTIKINSFGRITGSDHVFERGNVGDFATRNDPVFLDANCELSKFRDIFFTGKLKGEFGADTIVKIGRRGNVFDRCWFDYCDGDGVWIANGAHDNLITGCMFRGLGRASTTSSRKRDVRIDANCNRNTITNCSFLHIHSGPEVPDSAQRWSISSAAKGNIISNNMYEDGLLNHYSVGDAGEKNTVEEPTEHTYFGGAFRWKTSSYYGINFVSYPQTILANGEKDISVTAVVFYSALVIPFIRGDFSLPTGITLARAYVDSGNLHIVFANTTENDITINDERMYFGVNYIS